MSVFPREEMISATGESLDPDDWDGLRALGHRMVDDVMDYLRTVRDRPAWRPIPERARRALEEPVPRDGIGAERAYGEFVERVLPYPLGNIHPRFWGWVIGTGTPFGVLADMLVAAMNVNASGLQSAPVLVEERVLRWFSELLGFPPDARRAAGQRRQHGELRGDGGRDPRPFRHRRWGRGLPGDGEEADGLHLA